jgi:hypothetical protein
MAVYTKHILSGSVNGLRIPVGTVTTSGGTLLHAAQTATTGFDEIWLWAHMHGTTTDAVFVLRHGGATQADEIQVPMVPGEGSILICPGLMLNNGLQSRAFFTSAATASTQMSLFGWVNRVATG